MAKDGRLTIRDVPEYETSERNSYFSLLERFFQKKTICPKCKGHGVSLGKSEDGVVKEYATIRFEGIKELEQMKEEGFNLGDVIRSIIQGEVWEKKNCPLCHGSGFVHKQRVKAYKKRIKEKKHGKKRKRLKS